MNVLSAPAAVRNVKRAGEILRVLASHGLADWAGRVDIEWVRALVRTAAPREAPAAASPGERIRRALTDLGTTFIKLGQMLSVRPDLVGPEIAAELSKLQSDVPADPPEVVRATVRAELKYDVGEVFAAFDDRPLASASIGQVHRATLKSGEAVVVKVQHAGIVERLEADLEIVVWLADLLETHVEDAASYRPRDTAAEFRRGLLREVDFTREARAMAQFGANFAGDPTIHIPRAYEDLTTTRVMTVEFLDGIKSGKTAELDAAGFDRKKLARAGAEAFLKMVIHGLYHADPHPGNILVLRDGRLGLLDFGLVGRLDEDLREDIEALFGAVMLGDLEALVATVLRIGRCPVDLDRSALKNDAADLTEAVAGRPLEKIEVGKVLALLTEILRRHRILLPSGIVLLLKMLITLEGTGRGLDPGLEIAALLVPYQRQALVRRLSPERRLRQIAQMAGELDAISKKLPGTAMRVLERVERNEVDLGLRSPGLERGLARLPEAIVAAALLLSATGLFAVAALAPGAGWLASGGAAAAAAAGIALGFRAARR